MAEATSDTKYGPQYAKDDAFKAAARLHQSRFRVHDLDVSDFREYGNRLPSTAALAGKNFYPWPGLLEAVAKRFGHGDKKLYWDMLASDNVPFNFFVPLRDLPLAKHIVAAWTGDSVERIVRIEIEWAPSPSREHLGDSTSFDAYIEYERTDRRLGAVGVEAKYTEREYGWGAQERTRMLGLDSPYHRVHRTARLYRDDALPKLATRRLKQFWRNQLLGEAMLQRGSLARFTSVLLYPSANSHFSHATAEYAALVQPEESHRFASVPFEQFIATCRSKCETSASSDWLDYLEKRYIVPSPAISI